MTAAAFFQPYWRANCRPVSWLLHMRRALASLLPLLLVLFAALPAQAHPHVFVRVHSIIDYGADGVPTSVQQIWRFDEMFSSFAVQGLDVDGDGKYSREELADLAKINVTSLREYGFFTFAHAGGRKLSFRDPVDYWLDHDGKALTLHFTLPFAEPPPPAKQGPLTVEIYDPTYFVAFSFADHEPAKLQGAPADCRVSSHGPPPADSAPALQAGKLSEEFFTQLTAQSDFGQQFANVITVRCGAQAAVAEAAPPPPATENPAEDAPAPNASGVTEVTPADDIAARVDQALTLVRETPLAPLPQSVSPTGSASALGAFGVVRPDGVASSTVGFLGWIGRVQSAFYHKLANALSAARADGSAAWLLIGLSFLYGVFHAAGPGHGKTVIASYLVATGDTLKRGIAISFASGFAQALTAVLVVGVLGWIVGATSHAMGVASWWMEAASYVFVIVVGVALFSRKAMRLIRTAAGISAPAHVCGPDCHHAHMPDPSTLSGEWNWRRAGLAVLAVGLRPCTGALLILSFAMVQGMVWAGVLATFAMAVGTSATVAAIAIFAVGAKQAALGLASGGRSRGGALFLGGLEVLAGLAVIAVGVLLLGGLIAAGTPAMAG